MVVFEDENKRLETVIERHVALIPKVKETQVKSEVSDECQEEEIAVTNFKSGCR